MRPNSTSYCPVSHPRGLPWNLVCPCSNDRVSRARELIRLVDASIAHLRYVYLPIEMSIARLGVFCTTPSDKYITQKQYRVRGLQQANKQPVIPVMASNHKQTRIRALFNHIRVNATRLRLARNATSPERLATRLRSQKWQPSEYHRLSSNLWFVLSGEFGQGLARALRY